MIIEQRDPKALTPHPKNSRRHASSQITDLGRAMKEFGFHQPVVIDAAGTILVGHARTLAAIDIGLASIPVVVASDMTEAQQRALIIADNRLHELGAGWDQKILDEELRHLMSEGIDMSLVGFAPPEKKTAGPTVDEDDAPPLEDSVVSLPGDEWLLGDHRIICGDSTSPAVVANLMTYDPAIMVTDPPYGVNYDPSWRSEADLGTALGKGVVLNDDRADWTEVWKLFTGNVAYVWHAGLFAPVVEASLIAAGFDIRNQIVWHKGRFAIGRGNYHWQHEPCFYAARKKPKLTGPKGQSSIWAISHTRSASGHGTQKPVEAMRRPIVNHTVEGDFVFEPFSGSGTCIIACETTQRRCLAIELSPEYVDVAVRRWQAFADREATLAGTSYNFDEIAAQRAAAKPAKGKATMTNGPIKELNQEE